jgi:predicted nucleic acid-binding protein
MTGALGAIPAGSRILLDTSVLVAYLGATEPVATVATDLIEGCLRTGRNDGVISTISVAELLTRPFRTDRRAVDMTVAFLWSLPDLLVRSVDFLVAAEAARIRASTRLGMPDASILATGVLTTAQVLATNDRQLAGAASAVAPNIDVLLLAEVVG